jgi:antitoxin CptB
VIDETRLNRLRWRSRRGMLENDLILSRFLERCAERLTEDDIANLDELLHMTDNALWDLLSGRAEAADPRLASFAARVARGMNPNQEPKDVR